MIDYTAWATCDRCYREGPHCDTKEDAIRHAGEAGWRIESMAPDAPDWPTDLCGECQAEIKAGAPRYPKQLILR